jgi:hypothetical protein
MSTRQRLPNRRGSETFDVELAGLHYTATVSYFANGDPAEVFIANHKRGNASDIAARDAGILISLALQFGCPAQTIAYAVSRNSDGTASSIVGAVLDKALLNNTGGR